MNRAADLVDPGTLLGMRPVALVVVGLAGVAAAEPAPTFAIDLRSKDALADKATAALEDSFRTLGSAKTATWRSKGTRKDRIAASTDDCPNALTAKCAAEIGAKLGVDYVFAGWVESRNKKLVLALDVFSVKSGNRLRSLRDYAPNPTDPKRWARSILDRVTDTSTGSLEITCNAQRATVWIDGQQVTELFGGRASITDLVLGTHALEIRAAGYKTYVDEVTIDGATPINVLLQR